MRIRNSKLLQFLSWAGASAIRGWIGTVHYQHRSVGPSPLPENPGFFKQRYIFAFWHENMLLPAYRYSRPDIHVLISRHSDGQLITDVVHRLGLRTVRGSTTRDGRDRGGTEAMRQLLRVCRESHIVITPDGPRGPRRVLQPGVIYLAAKTGLPIVPVAWGYSHAWRAPSWDRFALPRPFSKGFCVTLPALHIPDHVTPDNIESYRLQVEQAMHMADEVVEMWAATGHFDARPCSTLTNGSNGVDHQTFSQPGVFS
jgi:lysophospholipid acyltransferase (LPLAT)-like uncharacterized protein